MNLIEAIKSSKEGNFITNKNFTDNQTLHYFNDNFYFDNGCMVTENFLLEQEYLDNNDWYIEKSQNDINMKKLKDMHERFKNTNHIIGTSYNECYVDPLEKAANELLLKMKLNNLI